MGSASQRRVPATGPPLLVLVRPTQELEGTIGLAGEVAAVVQDRRLCSDDDAVLVLAQPLPGAPRSGLGRPAVWVRATMVQGLGEHLVSEGLADHGDRGLLGHGRDPRRPGLMKRGGRDQRVCQHETHRVPGIDRPPVDAGVPSCRVTQPAVRWVRGSGIGLVRRSLVVELAANQAEHLVVDMRATDLEVVLILELLPSSGLMGEPLVDAVLEQTIRTLAERGEVRDRIRQGVVRHRAPHAPRQHRLPPMFVHCTILRLSRRRNPVASSRVRL